MSDNRPIGMMDSGLGGVAVLKAAIECLDSESFIYYGDNGNAPYGTKPHDEIKRLAFACASELVDMGVKAIVIACNTATSAAIADIRKEFSLPVISMEPAIKPAIELGGDGKILMLATAATCALERYISLRERLDTKSQVIDVGCHGMVEAIESRLFEPGAFDEIINTLLSPFNGMKIDAIVLGCTHFTFVQTDIEKYARAHFVGECKFFDGREGTVKRLKKVLNENDMLADKENKPKIDLYTTGDEKFILPLMRKILTDER